MAKIAGASKVLPLRWPAVAALVRNLEAAHSGRVLAAAPAGRGCSPQAVPSCSHAERSASQAVARPDSSAQSDPWWRRVLFSSASQSRPSLLSEGSSFASPAAQGLRFDAAAPFALRTRQSSAAASQGQEPGRTSGGGTTARADAGSSSSSDAPVLKKRKTRPYQAAAAAEVKGRKGKLFAVLLDGKELLTPARDPVQVPSLPLAYAIAAEWEWQEGLKLRPYTMPLMKLAATSIDQIPKDRDHVIASLLDFLHTDHVLIRHPEPNPEPDTGASLWGPSGADAIKGSSFFQQQQRLCERQRDLLDPLVALMKSEFGVEAVPSFDCIPPQQSDGALAALKQALSSLDNWHLAAVDSLVSSTRSVTIGLLLSKGLISLEAATAAAHLEEDFQIESAGFVEGGHDIDLADLKVKLLAPTVFIRLLDM